MKDFRGKNAIVTGASRGLGVYIAKALAKEGVNLALAARSAGPLEETRAACEALGVRAIAIPGDITSIDDQRHLVAETERQLGSIDILVNNAGIELTEALDFLSIEQIDELLRTNLNAPIWLTKLVLPSMRARRSGAIVNVSSLAGKSPVPFGTIYAASKAGLNGFTESLASELEGSGIEVSAVCPSFVSDAGMWAEHEAGGVKAPRLVRPVSPEKVARAVLKALRGSPEVLVASGPMRPLFVLFEALPRQKRMFVRRLGVRGVFRDEAVRLRQGHDRGSETTPEPEPAESRR